MEANDKFDINDPEFLLVAGGIINPALVPEAERYVDPVDISDERLKLVWTALTSLVDAGVKPNEIDIGTIISKCAKSKETQRKVGSFISEMIDGLPKFVSLVSASQAVRKRATMRLALEGMRQLAKDIKDQLDAPGGYTEELEEKMAKLSVEISARSDKTLQRTQFKTMATEVAAYFDRVQTGDTAGTIPTGLQTLDERLGGGIRVGELTVILGGTGSGKTALASQICDHAAANGFRSIMFSMEVDPLDVYIRDVERVAKKSRWDLRSPYESLRESASAALVAAQSVILASTNSKIVYGEPVSVAGIRQAVLTERLRGGNVDLVVVDHAQVAQTSAAEKKGIPRYLEVKGVAEGLRRLASKLNVAVVLTAQLNPSPKGETPTMELVRESKDINNTAEVVLLIWHEKESLANGKTYITKSHLNAAKVRAGSGGHIDIEYHGECYRFEDVQHQYQHHDDGGGAADEPEESHAPTSGKFE